MSPPPPGDQVRVTVLVEVPPVEAFRVFTDEIDLWWRQGLRYRIGRRRSVVRLEPGVGGRLLESFDTSSRRKEVPTGRVTVWEPPARLVLRWRAVNFAPDEETEVEVRFDPSPSGTSVTVTHRGWSRIRPDHPVRHGLDVAGFVRFMGLWWADLMTSLRERAVRP